MIVAPVFTCQDCGRAFTLADTIAARYPNWRPRKCLDCRPGKTARSQGTLSPQEALEKYHGGPQTGVFTDGGCEPNPGRGGWGAVKVIDGMILSEAGGSEARTTNNRMELRALIEGFKMLSAGDDLAVFSDSQLCIKTINLWAPVWERNGWTRGPKREPIANLDLVQELFDAARSRPRARLEWIQGHAGSRWNEYADALTRATRS